MSSCGGFAWLTLGGVGEQSHVKSRPGTTSTQVMSKLVGAGRQVLAALQGICLRPRRGLGRSLRWRLRPTGPRVPAGPLKRTAKALRLAWCAGPRLPGPSSPWSHSPGGRRAGNAATPCQASVGDPGLPPVAPLENHVRHALDVGGRGNFEERRYVGDGGATGRRNKLRHAVACGLHLVDGFKARSSFLQIGRATETGQLAMRSSPASV